MEDPDTAAERHEIEVLARAAPANDPVVVAWQVEYFANPRDREPEWNDYYITEELAEAAAQALRDAGLGHGDSYITVHAVEANTAVPVVTRWWEISVPDSSPRAGTMPASGPYQRTGFDRQDVPTVAVEIIRPGGHTVIRGLDYEAVTAAYRAMRDAPGS